jgi:DNA segregation ATPase FtsK/SpoIIIE-like protein
MKYVYILKGGDNLYKVGVAINVSRRLKNIQTSNGHRIYVVTTKLCKNASNVESKIHHYLKKMESGGGSEWFALEPEDVLRSCIMLHMEPEIDVYSSTNLNDQLNEQNLRHKRLEKKLDLVLNTIQVSEPKKQAKEELMPPITELALDIIKAENKASTSLLQRKLGIGYGRASRIMDEFENRGIIGMADGTNQARKVLI